MQLVLAFIQFREVPPETSEIRSTILAPEGATFDFTEGNGLPALSPDGRLIVFGARTSDGRTPLWVRSLNGLTAQPLAGTEGAMFPFWSPDSKSIAFFADGKLKKIQASGGQVTPLTDAPLGRGGSWSSDDVIIFSPSFVAGPILRVSAAGGVPTQVSSEFGSFPWFLPDGRHFLYQEQQGGDSERLPIRIGSLEGSPSTPVGTGTNAIYSRGHLLFLDDNTLMAQPFDTERLMTTGRTCAGGGACPERARQRESGGIHGVGDWIDCVLRRLGRAECGSDVVRSQWPAWDDGWQSGEAGCICALAG